MTMNIKPCPFCGGRCKTIKGTANQDEWEGTFWRVYCSCCQARQLFHKTEAKAIDAWNRRATDQRDAGEPIAWLVVGSQGQFVEFDNEHGGIPLYTQEQASTIIRRTERLDAMLTESVQAMKAAEQRIAELEAKQAKREAQPVRYLNKFSGMCVTLEQQPNAADDFAVYAPLYTASPGPAVPDEMTGGIAMTQYGIKPSNYKQWVKGYNTCRTAMLARRASGGYKLVPVEPTEDMIAAAMNCDDVQFSDDDTFCVNFGNIYEAMLAAAPGAKE